AEESHLNRDRWSYPLLADELRRWSERPKQDTAELFRRLIFNAAVTNNDDHPRNHALLRGERGWRLSPTYDLVPVPMVRQEQRDLALVVGSFGRAASRYYIISQAARFGLTADAANHEFAKIVDVIKDWQAIFGSCHVADRDIDYVAPAFLPACLFFEEPPPPICEAFVGT